MAELYHHGILGQKWGIRRFQNPDGTLTPAGKRRYGAEDVANISSAKGIEKRLNDLDQAIAYNRRDFGEATNKASKLFKKSVKAKNEEKRKKIQEKWGKSLQKRSRAENYIDQGRRETTELLKKANQSGYSIESKEFKRSVARGKDLAINLAVNVPLTLLTGFVVIQTPAVTGRKYKIRGLRDG